MKKDFCPTRLSKEDLVNIEKPLLLDAFLFYNEIDLLKARLEYLGPLVDKFIISEANVDFSGAKKDFFLNDDLIRKLPFNGKIIYQREFINLFSPKCLFKKLKYLRRRKSYLWKIQDAQRNAILKSLRQYSPNDILIFGDLDEFPSEYAINQSKKILLAMQKNASSPEIYSCEQQFFYYNVHNCAVHGGYLGTAITSVRFARKIQLHKIRSDKDRFSTIKNGGWHFSYFLNETDIAKKIAAICEVENLDSYKQITSAEISEKRRSGIDLFNRDIPLDSSGKAFIPDSLMAILKQYLPNCT